MFPSLRKHSRFIGAAIAAVTILMSTTACSTESKIERHMERGDAYLTEGKQQEAIIEFLNVIQLDANHREATQKLGIALFDTGQFGPAFAYLQRAVEFDSDNAEVQTKLATIYLLRGQREEAREESAAVLDRDATDLDALAIYADTAGSEGEIDGAIRRLENARAQHEARAKFHLALASLHLRKRDVETAESYFQEAARREPDSPDAHLALGTFYLAKREVDNAEAEFNKAAETAPIRSAAQIRVVDFYRLLGNTEEANRRLDTLVAEAPDFVPAWTRIANYAFADGHYDRCEEALEHLLESNPRDPEALRMMGEVYRERGDAETAEAKFRETITILQDYVRRRPDLASAHFRLAQMHTRVGEIAQAMVSLEKVIELAPNSPQASMLLAELQIRTGQAERAVPVLESVLQRQPSPVAFRLLGMAYMAGQNYARATPAFMQYQELAPTEAEAPFRIGTSLLSERKIPESLDSFEKALTLDPAYVEPLAAIARVYAGTERLGAALQRVKAQMAKIEPTGQHHYLLGQLHMASNQTDIAEAEYKKAVELAPDLSIAYAQLAGIYVRAGQSDVAIAEMDQALEHNPENQPILMLKGMLHHQGGDIDSARETYESLLAINGRFGPAANNLAYIYQQDGRLEEALDWAEIARTENPDNPDIADTLGWILYERGTYQRALSLLKEAAAARPDNAEVMYHLGFAHHKIGEFQETMDVLTKALALDPDFAMANEAQTVLDELR
jgi:prepilin-type processing-associated H-X9-DG protein